MSYKTISDNTVLRLEDGVFIPVSPSNRDYRAYLAWVAEGNTPEPADPPPPPSADWKKFLKDLRTTSVFSGLRGAARTDVAANALATELRTVLGEAALGLVEVEVIQGLVNQLTMTNPQKTELQALITANNIPITIA